jgi:hypothetical protein
MIPASCCDNVWADGVEKDQKCEILIEGFCCYRQLCGNKRFSEGQLDLLRDNKVCHFQSSNTMF